MTKAKLTNKLLYRYAHITKSLIWERRVEQRVALQKRQWPSLNDLARLFPTEQDRKILNNPGQTVTYASSKIHWSRLRRGIIRVRNNTWSKRIEKVIPELQNIRTNLVWDLLGCPTMELKKLRTYLYQFESKFVGKLITTHASSHKVSFKRLYSDPLNIELAESADAFAIKLALFRMSKLQHLGNAWLYTPKELVLHLLRIVTRKTWSHHADRLVRLLLIFIEYNQNRVSEKEIEQLLLVDHVDDVFLRLFQWVQPASVSPHLLFQSLRHYIQTNLDLVENFWRACFPQSIDSLPSSRASMETLFWADTHSQIWLDQKIPKEKLFCPESPVFEEQYRSFFNGCRRRIW